MNRAYVLADAHCGHCTRSRWVYQYCTGKKSKAAVEYQDNPKYGQQCSACQYYRSGEGDENTGKCIVVKGKIAPDAWCNRYSPG